ncbi:RNA polymerase sigma factor [Paraliomyxa miuraensis]|uniref:RNA polymerase sigma factor n=1 Tax=Paraliomyxa miuraensis TaxID=376150 RepID=UPI00225B08BF|nr:RNA polymerase sigma factor [Paraliomyxa miuraensis]MCX4244872.1 RNA polymerase sigma factor [Paraliomyxa miuraensis]
MTRYVDDDPRAFVALYRVLQPRVRARITAIVGVHGAVDDLVQLTFLLAHRSRHRWAPNASVGDAVVVSWFRTIARNVALSELRRGGVRPVCSLEAADEHPGPQLDPEQIIEERERTLSRHQALSDGLERLAPAEQELLRRVLDGASLCDVARTLGLRPGAVRVRAHRARERLRSLVVGRASSPGPAGRASHESLACAS